MTNRDRGGQPDFLKFQGNSGRVGIGLDLSRIASIYPELPRFIPNCLDSSGYVGISRDKNPDLSRIFHPNFGMANLDLTQLLIKVGMANLDPPRLLRKVGMALPDLSRPYLS